MASTKNTTTNAGMTFMSQHSQLQIKQLVLFFKLWSSRESLQWHSMAWLRVTMTVSRSVTKASRRGIRRLLIPARNIYKLPVALHTRVESSDWAKSSILRRAWLPSGFIPRTTWRLRHQARDVIIRCSRGQLAQGKQVNNILNGCREGSCSSPNIQPRNG